MSITRDSIHKRRATGGKRVAYRKKRKHELGRQPSMTRLGKKVVHLVRCRFGIKKYRALRLESGNFAWPTQAMAARTRILNVVYNASNNELVRTNTLVRNAIVQIDSAPYRAWFLRYYGIELGKKTDKADKKMRRKAKKAEKKAAKKAEMEAKKAEEAAKKAAEAKPEEKKEDAKPEEKKEGEEKKKYKRHNTAAERKRADYLKEKAKKARKNKPVPPRNGPSKAQLRKYERRQKLYKIEKALAEQFLTGKLLACITSRPGQVGRADGYILEGKELEFYMRKLEKKKKAK